MPVILQFDGRKLLRGFPDFMNLFTRKFDFNFKRMLIRAQSLRKERMIRVFHVEDYKIMRDGIRHLLSQDEEIEIAGEAKDGEELLRKLEIPRLTF